MQTSPRNQAEEFLVAHTHGAVSKVEASAMSDEQLAEHVLAIGGYAIVSAETARLIDKIERAPSTATLEEYSAVLYAIYSGPAGDYWRRKEFA